MGYVGRGVRSLGQLGSPWPSAWLGRRGRGAGKGMPRAACLGGQFPVCRKTQSYTDSLVRRGPTGVASWVP